MPTTPTLPLVEVPTPGLKATKVNKSLAPPSSTIKRSKVVVEQTPPSAKKRLKLREN
jgi:hypothetical protein